MIARAIQSSKISTLSKCFEPLVALALVELALVELAQVDLAQVDLPLMDLAQVDLPLMDLAQVDLAQVDFRLLSSPPLALVHIQLIESFLNVPPPPDRPLIELPFLGS
jgi:uncharacterized protein YjbI with pentapeptide repeats